MIFRFAIAIILTLRAETFKWCSLILMNEISFLQITFDNLLRVSHALIYFIFIGIKTLTLFIKVYKGNYYFCNNNIDFQTLPLNLQFFIVNFIYYPGTQNSVFKITKNDLPSPSGNKQRRHL